MPMPIPIPPMPGCCCGGGGGCGCMPPYPAIGGGAFITCFGASGCCGMMLIGYAVIAVPTGIVISSMQQNARDKDPHASGRSCLDCHRDGHRHNAIHCWNCGSKLEEETPDQGTEP